MSVTPCYPRPFPGAIGTVILGSPDWLGPAAILFALLLAAVILGYVPINRAWSAKLGLFSIKLLGILLVAACLLNPLGTFTRVKPGENIVLLVADNSASLHIMAEPSGATRGEQLKKLLLNKEAEWQVRLGQDFDLRRYIASERVTPVEDFTALSYDGSTSNLIAGLQSLHDRFVGNPLAGIIVFSDFIATDPQLLEKVGDWVPIYCVLPDGEQAPVDKAIGQIAVSKTAFEDAPVTIQAQVVAEDDFQGQIHATLKPLDEPAGETQTAVVNVTDPSSPRSLRFHVRPQGGRTSFYQLTIGDSPLQPGETATAASDAASDAAEATLANNQRTIVVERDRGPYRVLYVAGRPNWEHKFLGRAIAEDEQVNLVSLIRIARKEAKFDFRGRAGEEGNSLFRGFDSEVDAETANYDEPVLVRLNTKDEQELSGGFPKTKEALYAYHAIILDDIESGFFTTDQLTLLDRFVAERGGGLLMLGGIDTFRQGNWGRTPMRDALPVYLDRAGEEPSGGLKLSLTRDGWLQPWVRLRDTEDKERDRLTRMPAFGFTSSVRNVKPAAQVMAEMMDDDGRKFPALVAQNYGRGHSAALLIGDAWRWSLRRDELDEDDLAKAWRQTIRWLVSDVPLRIETSYDWTMSGQSKAIVLQVAVRNAEFEPQDNSAVHVTVKPPTGEPLQLDAQPSLTEPGVFEAVYVPRLAGAYRVEVNVDDDKGLQTGTAETGWASDPVAEEFQEAKVNRPLAEQIAERSRGQVLTQGELGAFVASLPYRNMPEQETQTYPLWHSPWLLAAALTCFALEWGLRRVSGLP